MYSFISQLVGEDGAVAHQGSSDEQNWSVVGVQLGENTVQVWNLGKLTD